MQEQDHTKEKTLKVNWLVSLYLILSPIVAAIGIYYWLDHSLFNWKTIILALIFYSIIEVSITAGYHRLFCHQAYKAKAVVRAVFLFFGSGAFQGSALTWSSDHYYHHRYVDDCEKDPYCIGKGFFWAHMGWLLFKESNLTEEDKQRHKTLMNDHLVVWQHKYTIFVGIFSGFILPALIASLWGDWFGGLLIAGVARSVINHHSTFLINSLVHCYGKQNYSTANSARDNWFAAFLTFGEGYHNFHHAFASDYRNGIRFYDWDPTKWLIEFLSAFGLTHSLIKVPREVIEKAKIKKS